MACERKYAVVIVRKSGGSFVLVPSADREFCEELASQFNEGRGDGLQATVAPHLLGKRHCRDD